MSTGDTGPAPGPGSPFRTPAPALLLLGVFAVALAARVDVALPGTPVPQSLQTLAVVLVGAYLGARGGGGALLLYLAAGAAGLPVFAGGSAGAAHLIGPTGGYLVGFALAAAFVGWLSDRDRLVGRGFLGRTPRAFALMALAHAVMLGLGWARLSLELGASGAYGAGVAPFLGGGLIKSGIAAGIVVWFPRRGLPDPTART